MYTDSLPFAAWDVYFSVCTGNDFMNKHVVSSVTTTKYFLSLNSILDEYFKFANEGLQI